MQQRKASAAMGRVGGNSFKVNVFLLLPLLITADLWISVFRTRKHADTVLIQRGDIDAHVAAAQLALRTLTRRYREKFDTFMRSVARALCQHD